MPARPLYHTSAIHEVLAGKGIFLSPPPQVGVGCAWTDILVFEMEVLEVF